MGVKGKEMFRSIFELLDIDQQIKLAQFCIPENIYFEIVGATMDDRYSGPDYQGKVQTSVTRDDRGNVTSLHTKFLPPMNAYHTLVTRTDDTIGTAKKKAKPADLVVIPYSVRIGRSTENVRMEIIKEIPEEFDAESIEIMIQPIF